MSAQPTENNGKKTGHENLIPWKPGCPSPNPGGRPKGLASYIRDQSLDGTELADFLFSVMRGEFAPLAFRGPERIKACEILLDRGFGKQPVIDGDKNIKPTLNLAELSKEELDFLENVRMGMAAIYERVNRGKTP